MRKDVAFSVDDQHFFGVAANGNIPASFRRCLFFLWEEGGVDIQMGGDDKTDHVEKMMLTQEDSASQGPLVQCRIPFYLFLNAASSIGIVVTNKLVFQVYKFKYGTLLTFIHFVFTAVGLEICRHLGVFEKKSVEMRNILPLCISFCGFVVLTNISLVYNSIGFYQLMKVLTTPLIALIQVLCYDVTFSLPIKLALTTICVGVAIATVTDTEANALGTLVASSALLVTSMYQIWVGTKQKSLVVAGTSCSTCRHRFQLLSWLLSFHWWMTCRP